MGTTFSVILYGADAAQVEAAADEALGEARRLDEMLSNYRPDSEWSAVNRQAAREAIRVSPELFQILSAGLRYSLESEGAFDITVGPLMKVWGFFKGSGKAADRAEVVRAMKAVGYRYLGLEEEQRAVSFARPGMEICPGGMGKGYAVDRMVDILKRKGFEIALAAASRSSLYGLGAPPSDPRGWKVDILDPAHPKKRLAEVHLKNMSISTSGTFEKYFLSDGRIYSHIMDPRSGYPVQGTLLASVIAPNTLDSEVWAKLCVVNGVEWCAARKPGDFRVFFCEAGHPGRWLP